MVRGVPNQNNESAYCKQQCAKATANMRSSNLGRMATVNQFCGEQLLCQIC